MKGVPVNVGYVRTFIKKKDLSKLRRLSKMTKTSPKVNYTKDAPTTTRVTTNLLYNPKHQSRVTTMLYKVYSKRSVPTANRVRRTLRRTRRVREGRIISGYTPLRSLVKLANPFRNFKSNIVIKGTRRKKLSVPTTKSTRTRFGTQKQTVNFIQQLFRAKVHNLQVVGSKSKKEKVQRQSIRLTPSVLKPNSPSKNRRIVNY